MRASENQNIDQVMPPADGMVTLGVGVASGLIIAILEIALTLLNASAYQKAARTSSGTSNLSPDIANLLTTILGVEILAGVLICLLAGFIVGKKTMRSRPAFYAGMLVGAITFVSNAVTRYIPNYPGNLAIQTPTSAPGLAIGISFLLILIAFLASICGLISLGGAWIATRVGTSTPDRV